MLIVVIACCLILASIPTTLFFRNLQIYKTPPCTAGSKSASVLIPARNEERSIQECVEAVLLSASVDLEVIVLDDHSEDATAAIVKQLAQADTRVRLASAPLLPPGWCGKQFACSVLAQMASKPLLCFIDADVRLAPDGLSRMIGALRGSGVALLSGFPRQITRTPLEQLVLPLIHFLLLGFLPLHRMRQSLHPSLGAGCGQLFLADRDAYRQCGGHAAIRESRHDGLTLPKAFRRAGFRTDVCDATQIASCRMYRSAREVISGLLKNATEGLADPKRIVPFSLLLLLGQVLPAVLFAYVWIESGSPALRVIAGAALVISYLPRIVAAFQFRQPFLAALLHPVSIVILLAIQWTALLRAALRISSTWKGRRYSTS